MSFVRYNTEDSVISAETVVRGLWSGDSNSLSFFNTSSVYSEYYLDIYNLIPSTSGSSIQFDIQYGNLNGSGSAPINPNIAGYSPSRVVYGQYRNLVYGTETTNFSFDGGVTTAEDIYVINFARSRYKESLLPGTLNIILASGSAPTIRLTDDSNVSSTTKFIGENRYFNIISGSNGSAYTSTAASIYYGIVLPDLDIVILKASGSNSVSASIAPLVKTFAVNDNHVKFYKSISASLSLGAQSAETVSSRYFFTRVKNSDFNYTTNPSIIDANGNLLYSSLINNPQTYITTVGLYNDNNELLAVAKLSKPLIKDFTKEALVRIKLDY